MFTNTTAKQTFTVANYSTPVSTTFPFQNQYQLQLWDSSVGYSSDPPNLLVLNSDYSVSGGGYDSLGNMLVGSVTMLQSGQNNVQVGDNIVVMRNIPLQQQTSSQQATLTPYAVEQALDLQMMLTQQLNENISRCLQFEPDEVVGPTTGLYATLFRNQRLGLFQTYSSATALVPGAPTWTAGTGSVSATSAVLISGTPANGQLAGWTGQYTLKGITLGTNLSITNGVLNATGGGGTGNVSNTGTPTNNQLAGWTNSTTIQGITLGTGLSIGGTTLNVTAGNSSGSSSWVQYSAGSGAFGANSGFTSDTAGNVVAKSLSISSGAYVFNSANTAGNTAVIGTAPQFGSSGGTSPTVNTGAQQYIYAWYGSSGPWLGTPTGWITMYDSGLNKRCIPYYTPSS